MTWSQETSLDELEARLAIHDALMRYCRGVDRGDEELVGSAYHADAHDEHGEIRGPVTVVIPALMELLRTEFSVTQHAVANMSIARSGNVADVESSFVAYHISRSDSRFIRQIAARDDRSWLLTFGGRYLDHFTKREDWRIERRIVVHDWSSAAPIEHSFEGRDRTFGTRDRSDPSYAMGWLA